MDNPLFLISVLTGTTFLIAGFVMLKFPPKKINNLYGYRTSSSMKSQKRWDFAQTYSAREMIKLGVILVLLSLIGWVFKIGVGVATGIGTGLVLFMALLLFIRVEKALKDRFLEE